jgi:hypothetical protein
MKLNQEMQDHCMRRKSDLHVQFCKTILLRNNVANVGIKLYNKLPEKLMKLEKIEEFKRKLKYFLLQYIFFLWMNICLTEYYYQLFITMHTFLF